MKAIVLKVLEEVLSEDNCSQPLHNQMRDCHTLHGSSQQGLASHSPVLEREQTANQHVPEKFNLWGNSAIKESPRKRSSSR